METLGYSREEVIGRNFGEFIHPDWREHFKENFPRFKAVGEILGVEFDMVRKDGSTLVVSFHGKIGNDPQGHFQQTHCIFQDITKRRLAEETLQRIEWMLSPKPSVVGTEIATEPACDGQYGDLTTLNQGGLISQSIDKQILQGIASEYLDLLETSSAIYERNGDYALGLFSSSWCRLMDSASRKLCNTDDNAAALASGKWRCHESCWTDASRQAIDKQGPIDIECSGGLRLYAIPILANGEVIGAINFGYGDPPREEAKLRTLADSYNVDYRQLLKSANSYDSRPPFIIELAKKRLQMSARLISLLVERKITEEALSQSEVRHRTLINTIPDLVWLKDAEGIYRYCNKAFERFFMVNESSIIDKTDYDFITKELANSFRLHDRKVMETNGPCVNEDYISFADNQYQGLFETIKTPMRDRAGNIIGVLGIARDITDRKEKDQKLQELILDQEAILNNVPAFIFFKDTKNNIIKITESVAKATGLPKSEIEGKATIEIYPDMADQYWEDDLEVIRSGQPKLGIVEAFPAAEGKKKWLITDKVPYFENDQIVGVLVFATDISERVEYEIRLKESEKKFKSLFENAADAIYLVAMDGRILDCNTSTQKQTGYSKEEMLTMQVSDLDPRALEEKDRENIWEKITIGESATISTHHLKKDRTRFPVDIRLSRIELQEEVVLLAFVRDVTEKVATENLLRQSQKMEAIGTLAGGIAHDFNNILAAILGYAELAQDSCPAGSMVEEDLDQIIQAGSRAKELVKQILTFSRQTDSEKIHFQPATIVKETIKLLRSSLPTTIVIKQEIDVSTDLIFAEPTQMHQIVMNICTNAFHSMEKTGGTLSISLKNKIISQQDHADNPDIQPGNFIQLSIGDSGPGIAPQVTPKIFDPYFTTKGTGKGTGMGLAIVHGIIKSYNGVITCQSQVGKGTIFNILLPAVEKVAATETKQAELFPVGIEHILLIDDEKMLVDMGKTMLERLGYRVTACISSFDALNIFSNQPQSFDLVITDQTMPGMTGVDLARTIGIKGFALKPMTMKETAALIRKVLEEAS